MKQLNSVHLRVLNNLAVIERCALLGDNSKKTVIHGMYAIWDVRHWEVSLYYKEQCIFYIIKMYMTAVADPEDSIGR